ncbi:MAG: MBL fold metallo-hydrolase [Eubacterium sp.]|nr:MBL fold metallo-hydrolase [Eubacterium sp.]MCI8918521.1 MBL fold metallo-hydrolase [Eubacterium sp.]
MLLEFLGAAHEVTGSCHFVQSAGKNMLVDCGMEQGPDLYVNQEIPVNASLVDYVFVTHAHIDHSGLLPLLYSRGFRGQIYATKATCELCNIMLKDSAHIQMFEAEWRNRKARRAGGPEVVPLYDMDDAVGVLGHFVSCEYDTVIEIGEDLKVRFVDAGHLLGSSSIELWLTEDEQTRKLVFSGDIGTGSRPLIKDPEYINEADYVIMESTYGNKIHAAPPDYAVTLAEVIKETFIRGGNVVIPAFSVGRTQELLFFLRRIKSEHLLPGFEGFDVYVDSPLSIEATNVFHKNNAGCFNEEAKELIESGVNPIRFQGLHTSVTSDESRAINFIDKPIVIISASGMCEAGRIRHHLKHNLWRSDSTIVFVGFQVPGTLGNMLLHGARQVRLFGETVEVNAKILNLPGISGHADREQLTKWAGAFAQHAPKKFFIVHGEDAQTDAFAAHLHQEFGYEAAAPYSGDVYDLMTGLRIKQGLRRRTESKAKSVKASTNVFARLLAAGERLLAVIHKVEGRPNKELGKFADQINALCDKWSK